MARTGQADGARYREIESWLRERCQALPAGSLLPSEQELSDRFGVSRMTARHAVQVLAQAGLVERRRGAGTFVAPPPLHRGEAILNSFTQEMLSRGLVPGSRVLRAEVGTAPREAAVLGLPPESWVVRIDRVRYASGVPVAVERAVLPGECEPVLGFDLERGSLHAALASLGRRLGRATGYVTARLASAEEAQLLDLATPAALLVETRLITDVSGRPAESTETAYAGSRWVIDTGAFVAPPAPAAGGDGSPAGSSAG